MLSKVIIAVAFIAAASGSGYAPAIQVYQAESAEHHIGEFNSHPQYTYAYGVNDAVSGDSKSLTESRDGDVVHGEYSLVDADGYKRTVKYTADDINGFNAVVDRKPIHKAVILKESTPAPVTYTAPKVIHQAPHAYAVPTYIKSIPSTYETRSVFKPRLTYSAGPVEFAYNAPIPTLIKGVAVAYSAPVAYTSQHIIKTVPAAYGQW